jgi:phenylacetate-coenzyme A ligase PaaK-like adenylate-forming protein
MTTTIAPGLASLRARMRAERGPRLAAQIRRLGWNADQLAAHQTRRLRVLLATAIERSPFHAGRLGHIDPATFTLADLSRLPTMTKAEMMDSFDAVVTDPRLTRPLVEDHLRRCGCEPALLLGDYVCLTTGGSSGLRGIFVQTIAEYADLASGMMRGDVVRLRAAADAPADAPARRVVAMVAAAAPVHGTGLYAVARSDARVQVEQVPITLTLAEAVERLNAVQPTLLAGYPSRLAQLAGEQDAGRLRIAPRAVTALSETLTDANRAAIATGFGVQPANIFGSTEGLVGYGEPGESELTFATDLCLAELVDADGRRVPPGTSSAKLLITNLHNLTQPLIRYELNDSFTACRGGEPGGYLRATVDGRDDGAFNYGSTVIHPLALRAVLTHFEAMTEYQVRQTARGVDVAVVVRDDLDRAALAAALADELRRCGLNDPEVTIAVVPAIAPHAETGKIRRFIPAGQ